MSIGTRVRQYREARNWSQEDLAMRLDTTQTTISNIESDKNIPNSLLLNKIAQELQVDINDLLNDSANNIMSNNEFSDHAVAAVNQSYIQYAISGTRREFTEKPGADYSSY
ncbi:helix-turn-helix domain-containing protein [uncultured Chryseobacterium sp.]|uniref:helix-turn-helix domain-containing protein n=1 Tax=uncultured Chryseobacterium sp. TaxID=259322 RepID=UPI0037479236